MPKKVDHRQRREAIARALWRVVDQQGVAQATMREVAQEAGISLGQLQHYFGSRTALLTFAMDFAAEQRSLRVQNRLHRLGREPHPRDILALMLTELLPLQTDSRASSRMSAAYVLEALHDRELRDQAGEDLRHARARLEELIRTAIADGHIEAHRDPGTETDLLLALTGFTTLLELGVVQPEGALSAIDAHLDRLFAP
ncbi:TetR/AcrR family transcriptional regulator [Sciscionella marina]|uniref:TetR/AcrR family transcriptional regulator n=1 Tax=Sciscionella marina TaxID=508770 RepID=UPI000362DA42|nr:TetR/AcrR family transcriptional regulator [Sciscionella marina]